MQVNFNYSIKKCPIGVGKSCLLYHYINSQFKDEYSVTLGVEFASKNLYMVDNTKIKLQIWDTVKHIVIISHLF